MRANPESIHPYPSVLESPAVQPEQEAALRARKWALFFGLVGLTLLIYAFTLSRTIGSFDSAEMVTAAYTLGIPHAPGYPMYLLLAHAAARFPLGDPALNVNALSALFGALTSGVVFLCAYELTGAWRGAALPALMLAFSNAFWSSSVVAEVYTLSTFLIALVVLFALRLHRAPQRRMLFWLALAGGLALAHHSAAVLIMPWAAGLVARPLKRLPRRAELAAAGLFLLPFLFYLYFPLRSLADPALNYVGDYFSVDLTTLPGVAWLVSGRMFGQALLGRPLAATIQQFVLLVGDLWLGELGIGLLLSLLGAWSARARGKQAESLFLLASTLSVLLFFAAYNVVDNRQMILPAFVTLAPLCALGFEAFLVRFDRRFHSQRLPSGASAAVTLALAGIFLLGNWSFADRSRDRSAEDYARQALSQVDPNAFIVSQWTTATPLEYLQLVEGLRPDVTVFDRGLFALGERDRLARQAPYRTPANADRIITQRFFSLLRERLASGPVYVTERDPAIAAAFCLIPHQGRLLQVYPVDHPLCSNPGR